MARCCKCRWESKWDSFPSLKASNRRKIAFQWVFGCSAFNRALIPTSLASPHFSLFISRRKCKWHIESNNNMIHGNESHTIWNSKKYASQAEKEWDWEWERHSFLANKLRTISAVIFIAFFHFLGTQTGDPEYSMWKTAFCVCVWVWCVCQYTVRNSDCINFHLCHPEIHQIHVVMKTWRTGFPRIQTEKDWKMTRKKSLSLSYLTIDLWCSLFAIQCLDCFLLLAMVTMAVLALLLLLLLLFVVMSSSPCKQFPIENEHPAEIPTIFRVRVLNRKASCGFTHPHMQRRYEHKTIGCLHVTPE